MKTVVKDGKCADRVGAYWVSPNMNLTRAAVVDLRLSL
jgi:hypothetical protein